MTACAATSDTAQHNSAEEPVNKVKHLKFIQADSATEPEKMELQALLAQLQAAMKKDGFDDLETLQKIQDCQAYLAYLKTTTHTITEIQARFVTIVADSEATFTKDFPNANCKRD
jgi:hypothetical protein